MAHGPLVEIDDTAGPERPHVIDLDDDLLAGGFDERKFRSHTELDAAKFLTQARLDGGCPHFGIITLARGCSRAALLLAGLERIIRGRCADDLIPTGGIDDGT